MLAVMCILLVIQAGPVEPSPYGPPQPGPEDFTELLSSLNLQNISII